MYQNLTCDSKPFSAVNICDIVFQNRTTHFLQRIINTNYFTGVCNSYLLMGSVCIMQLDFKRWILRIYSLHLNQYTWDNYRVWISRGYFTMLNNLKCCGHCNHDKHSWINNQSNLCQNVAFIPMTIMVVTEILHVYEMLVQGGEFRMEDCLNYCISIMGNNSLMMIIAFASLFRIRRRLFLL